jgi:hypothetical protein
MHARSVATTVLVPFVVANVSVIKAQAPADQVQAVLRSALREARTFAPPGGTALGFADSLNVSQAQREQIAHDLGYEPSSLKSKRVCSGGPGPAYCHLSGVLVFLQVTQFSISGHRAQVYLTAADETTSPRQPIHYRDLKVVLKQTGGSWVVAQVIPLADT